MWAQHKNQLNKNKKLNKKKKLYIIQTTNKFNLLLAANISKAFFDQRHKSQFSQKSQNP